MGKKVDKKGSEEPTRAQQSRGTHKRRESHGHGGHFIVPEARGGRKQKDNVYTPWAGHNHPQHVAWHILFSDALPEEAIELIRLWTRQDGNWDRRYFTKPDGSPNRRMEALKTLFDDMAPAQAIAWIEREFIRKEWLRR